MKSIYKKIALIGFVAVIYVIYLIYKKSLSNGLTFYQEDEKEHEFRETFKEEDKLPYAVRKTVPGTKMWQYIQKSDANNLIFIHTQVWLDTREYIPDTPYLRVSLVYNYKVRSLRSNIYTQDNIQYKGYILFNKKLYELTGIADPTFNNQRCVEGALGRFQLFCRKVIMFKIPFNASYGEYNDLLDRRFVFVADSIQPEPNEVDILIPPNGTNKGGFFVCSRPLYGEFSNDMIRSLVEWVEMYKILGVDVIHIYNSSVKSTPALERVLNYYYKEGTMFLHQFYSPLHEIVNQDGIPSIDRQFAASTHSDPASLNDCFFRNIFTYDYAIVSDTDEIIIPYKEDNYFKLFEGYNYTAASLGNAWAFFYDDSNSSDTSKVISYREYYSAAFTRGKSFHSTKYCPYIAQHQCAIKNPNHPVSRMPYTRSRTHHYRNECKYKQWCKPNARKYTASYVDRYKSTLETKLGKIFSFLDI